MSNDDNPTAMSEIDENELRFKQFIERHQWDEIHLINAGSETIMKKRDKEASPPEYQQLTCQIHPVIDHLTHVTMVSIDRLTSMQWHVCESDREKFFYTACRL